MEKLKEKNGDIKREGERGRERERERERFCKNLIFINFIKRERETDRQTDKQTEILLKFGFY